MVEVLLEGPLRRVGNVLALFIPVREARKAGLLEGETVRARIEPQRVEVFGFLKGKVPYTPYRSAEEHVWHDRV